MPIKRAQICARFCSEGGDEGEGPKELAAGFEASQDGQAKRRNAAGRMPSKVVVRAAPRRSPEQPPCHQACPSEYRASSCCALLRARLTVWLPPGPDRGSDSTCHAPQGGLKYHQYQVVGRHSPTEANENPELYRMKLWATDTVAAKSKFWCAAHLAFLHPL